MKKPEEETVLDLDALKRDALIRVAEYVLSDDKEADDYATACEEAGFDPHDLNHPAAQIHVYPLAIFALGLEPECRQFDCPKCYGNEEISE